MFKVTTVENLRTDVAAICESRIFWCPLFPYTVKLNQ